MAEKARGPGHSEAPAENIRIDYIRAEDCQRRAQLHGKASPYYVNTGLEPYCNGWGWWEATLQLRPPYTPQSIL